MLKFLSKKIGCLKAFYDEAYNEEVLRLEEKKKSGISNNLTKNSGHKKLYLATINLKLFKGTNNISIERLISLANLKNGNESLEVRGFFSIKHFIDYDLVKYPKNEEFPKTFDIEYIEVVVEAIIYNSCNENDKFIGINGEEAYIVQLASSLDYKASAKPFKPTKGNPNGLPFKEMNFNSLIAKELQSFKEIQTVKEKKSISVKKILSDFLNEVEGYNRYSDMPFNNEEELKLYIYQKLSVIKSINFEEDFVSKYINETINKCIDIIKGKNLIPNEVEVEKVNNIPTYEEKKVVLNTEEVDFTEVIKAEILNEDNFIVEGII